MIVNDLRQLCLGPLSAVAVFEMTLEGSSRFWPLVPLQLVVVVPRRDAREVEMEMRSMGTGRLNGRTDKGGTLSDADERTNGGPRKGWSRTKLRNF